MIEYWEAIKDDDDKLKCFFDFVASSIEGMKHDNKKAYWQAKLGIHECIFGSHFNEHLAKKAVSKMKNVDGTTGEHWTLEQIETLIKNHKLDYNCYDFYYLMNMLYSDFEGVLGDNADLYLKMACAYIDDPDADEGKVFRIWESRYVS